MDEDFKIINTPEAVKELRGAVDRMVRFLDFDDARWFVETFDKIFKEHPEFRGDRSPIAAAYETMLSDARLALLPFLTDQELDQALTSSILRAVSMADYDFKEMLRRRLAYFPDIEGRDKLRAAWRQRLVGSTEPLTKTRLLREDGSVFSGTVGAWVHDYLSSVGAGAVNTEARARYFSTGKLFLGLASEERVQVQKLIEVFDYLRLSSLTPEGFEEELIFDVGGELVTLTGGRLETTDPKFEATYEQFRRAHDVIEQKSAPRAAYEWKEEELAGFEQAAKAKYGNAAKAYGDELLRALQKSPSLPAKELLLGALLTVARLGWLPEIVRRKDVQDRLQAIARIKGATTVSERLKLGVSIDSAVISFFLRGILIDTLGLREDEAAKWAVKLGNLLAGAGISEYRDLAYFDLSTKTFKWKE